MTSICCDNNEILRWCHVRHLNQVYKNLERITQPDRELVKKTCAIFHVSIKDYHKIEIQDSMCINIFSYK